MKYFIGAENISAILENVRSAFPREASGLVLGQEFGRRTVLCVHATRSDENTLVSFRIRDETIRRIAQSLLNVRLRIRGCFHSHIIGAARPSRYDCLVAKAAGDLWLIYSVRFQDLRLFEWDGNAFKRIRFGIIRPGRWSHMSTTLVPASKHDAERIRNYCGAVCERDD